MFFHRGDSLRGENSFSLRREITFTSLFGKDTNKRARNTKLASVFFKASAENLGALAQRYE